MFIGENARLNFFRWRYEAEIYHKLALALAFAGLTGIGAQAKLYLPFTPVPVTAQVFFVLLSGVVLGRSYGALSMALYAALGAMGIPWFAGGNAGIEVLLGATGGYILGFILASYLIGYFTDTYLSSRSPAAQIGLMFSGVGIIYALGSVQLAHVAGMSAGEALAKGVLPFIPGDIFKALIAVGISTVLLPRGSYGNERDAGQKIRSVRLYLSSIAAVAAAFFLALFWMKLAGIKSATMAELLWYSVAYSTAVLLCAGSAVYLARK